MLRLLLEAPGGAAGVNKADGRGATALMEAARAGNVGVVEELLRRGARADVSDAGGVTPLSAALSRGHRAVALRLLKVKGLGLGEVTGNGSTLLGCAARGGDARSVERLLAAVPPSRALVASDRAGRTAEDVAREGGHRVAEAMLRRARVRWEAGRARRRHAISKVSARGTRASFRLARGGLAEAFREGDAATVVRLLRMRRGHPNSVLEGDADQAPLAVRAAAAGDVPLLRAVLGDKRCDVNLPDRAGRTPLHAAAKAGHLEAVEEVLKGTAAGPCDERRLTRRTTGQRATQGRSRLREAQGLTALQLARRAGRTEVVAYLEARLRGAREAALDDALLVGSADEVRALLAAPSPAPGKASQTRARALRLLQVAAREGDASNVSKLLAEVQPRDVRMRSHLLLHAVGRGHADVAEVLLTGGGLDVNWRSARGMTPLHLAAWHGHVALARRLLQDPACDPSLKNARGQTPADVARTKRHHAIAQLLAAKDPKPTPARAKGNADKQLLHGAASSSNPFHGDLAIRNTNRVPWPLRDARKSI